MVWAKKGGSSGSEVLKSEKVVNGVRNAGEEIVGTEHSEIRPT
ncbi:hypothetical protein [Clostridium acetobutylicum]|nr:hypothetical protein [Clostridium acetobutylicum]